MQRLEILIGFDRENASTNICIFPNNGSMQSCMSAYVTDEVMNRLNKCLINDDSETYTMLLNANTLFCAFRRLSSITAFISNK